MGLLRSAAKLAFATADLFLPSPRGPRILIYHQVGADLRRQMEVTTNDFERQVAWLAANREVVSLDDALQRWFEPGSDHLVVLTFDDGYRDTYTTAFPMLGEHRMPFTLYLATDALESSTGLDTDALSWDQVGEMLDSGLVTIGSHTHTHADLRYLTAEELIDELDTSDALIEAHLGVAPAHFAYPWGYWSAKADKTVRTRYSSAVVGAPSLGSGDGSDRFLIHRFPIQLSDRFMWFRPRLRGGLLVEEAVRRSLRGYRGPE